MTDYNFDESEFDEVPEEKKSSIDTPDIFAILLLIVTACLGAYFLMVFLDPQSPMNPFPPNTPIPPVLIPSATSTPLGLDDLWTETPTIQPTITETPRPTFTVIPTNTLIVLYTETFTPTSEPATATPELPFAANVQFTDAKKVHAETNCDWLGVGGTVTDKDNNPMPGVVIRVQGILLEEPVDLMTVSGVSQVYGKSGFEFLLGNLPVASENDLWIQLFDSAGMPLSGEVFFNTSAECEKNLVLIHFDQVR